MPGVMRISDAASLGLHAAAYLAACGGERVPTAKVASELGVSSAHLAKVLRELERAGIVHAKRGPDGGFVLARDAARVTLREVYEAIEGPIETEACLLGEQACTGNCILGKLMSSLDGEVRRKLEGIRLADVAGRFRAARARKGA